MKYLISGAGRCGTGYIAKVLTSAGVKCTHERVFTPEGLSPALERIALRRENLWWGWQGESSWLAAPFVEGLRDSLIIVHLVRNPKDVIDSLLRMAFYTHLVYKSYFDFARKHFPELDQYHSLEEKAACWYLNLNMAVEPYAHIFHRVEDDVRLLLNKLHIDYEGKELFSNIRYNHREGPCSSDVDLNALPQALRRRLKRMSIRYGYEWPVALHKSYEKPSIRERFQKWMRG